LLLALAAFGAQAQSLPAAVRACATVRGAGARLACYDREIARFPEPEGIPAADAAPAASATQAAAVAVDSAGGAQAEPSDHALAQVADAPASTRQRGRASVISAHLTEIEHKSAGLALRLDNGELWEQTQPVAGALSLHVGDAVQIERHLGSWVLNGPHVYGMSVRRR
jgi:hypothetical protein